MTDRDDARLWVALSLVPGLGGEHFRRLLSRFGLPQAIFGASHAQLCSVVSPKIADGIAEGPHDAQLAPTLAWLDEPGNQFLTLADPDYPPLLLETADPPPYIYVKGDARLLSRPALGVVGSRSATPQGERDAESFARALSGAGLTVVSGLALGIDAAAHRGALEGSGSTVAVIGTGIDIVYPARNRALAHEIAQRGAIISEFPIGTPSIAANFPRRNRIISGLSRGVLVVEAAVRSGSLITARLAGEQGREVFAIPGSIHSPHARGCHQLIRQGAKLVESAQDILEELCWQASAHSQSAAAPPHQHDNFMKHMGNSPCGVDLLVTRTGLTPDRVCSILLELELAGRVSTLPGGLYQALN